MFVHPQCHNDTPWTQSVSHVHELRDVGIQDGYCGCFKNTYATCPCHTREVPSSAVSRHRLAWLVVGRCRALVHVDKREQEGYKYVPRPISTADVDVNFANDAQLSWLTVKLALHAHDVWAKRKLAQVTRPQCDRRLRLCPHRTHV